MAETAETKTDAENNGLASGKKNNDESLLNRTSPAKTAAVTSAKTSNNNNNNSSSSSSRSGIKPKKTSVSFAANTKPSALQSYDRRIRLGGRNGRKKNPKIVAAQLVGGFLAFLGLMFYMAMKLDSVGRDIPGRKKKKNIFEVARSLDKVTKSLTRPATSYKKRKRKTDCTLFLSEYGSIHLVGPSLFSGKKYDVGDVVLEAGPLERIEESLYLSHTSMLLKHHPRLANLKGGTTLVKSPDGPTKAFIASRPIEPGEELFLEFFDHPHSTLGLEHPLFRLIPTEEDYALADEILEIERELQTSPYPQVRQRSRSSFGGGSRSLKAIQEVVNLFSPRVAAIVPGIKDRLISILGHNAPALYSSLYNRTIFWMEINAKCMDNVIEREGMSGGSDLYARIPIKKDSLVTVVPLYARHRETCTEEESCPPSPCFGHFNTTLQLCPLMKGSKLQYTNDTPNAKYRWSLWNNANFLAHKQPVGDVVRKYPLKFTFDIIASSDIKEGEKIVLDVPESNEFGIPVADDFFPAKWRGQD